MERLTSQKEFILKYLKSTKSHPTAEQIFIAVRKKIPRISLGTVYRNLDNFSKIKLIKEINGTTKRYDAELSSHNHFICKKCQNIFDLENTHLNTIEIETEAKKVGTFEDCETFVYGICKKCN